MRPSLHNKEPKDTLFILVARESLTYCRKVEEHLVLSDYVNNTVRYLIYGAEEEDADLQLYSPEMNICIGAETFVSEFRDGNKEGLGEIGAYHLHEEAPNHVCGKKSCPHHEEASFAIVYVDKGLVTLKFSPNVSPHRKALVIGFGIQVVLAYHTAAVVDTPQPPEKYTEAINTIYEGMFPLMEFVALKASSYNTQTKEMQLALTDCNNQNQMLFLVKVKIQRTEHTRVPGPSAEVVNMSGQKVLYVELLNFATSSVRDARKENFGDICTVNNAVQLHVNFYQTDATLYEKSAVMIVKFPSQSKVHITNLMGLTLCELNRSRSCSAHTLYIHHKLNTQEKKLILAYLIKYTYVTGVDKNCSLPNIRFSVAIDQSISQYPYCPEMVFPFTIPNSLGEIVIRPAGYDIVNYSRILYYDILDAGSKVVMFTIECTHGKKTAEPAEARINDWNGVTQFTISYCTESKLLAVYDVLEDLYGYYTRTRTFYDSHHSEMMTLVSVDDKTDIKHGPLKQHDLKFKDQRIGINAFTNCSEVRITNMKNLTHVAKILTLAYGIHLHTSTFPFDHLVVPRIQYVYSGVTQYREMTLKFLKLFVNIYQKRLGSVIKPKPTIKDNVKE